MKKHFRFIIIFCLGLLLSGAALDAFAWGGDVTLPATTGYRYTNVRVSVGYDGIIYCGRLFSPAASGPYTNWEVLKSTDNGVTFTYFTGSSVGASARYTSFDILCAGENATDFNVIVARGIRDTATNDNTLIMDKYNAGGTYVSQPVYETYNYAARGWLSVSVATDSRKKNTNSSPYVISLTAGKANINDSVILWTGNDGGTTMHRRGLHSTSGFVRSVSTSVGTSDPSPYGRTGVTWEESAGSMDAYGSVYIMFLYSDDATDSQYPGPFGVQGGAANYRNPCIAMSQFTGGISGPATDDYRVIVTCEYNADNNVWGLVMDSIYWKSPTFNWSKISAGSASGVSSNGHCVYDPLYNNFLFTYYNDAANTLPYVIKSLASNATDDATFFQPNYRDLSSASSVPMYPRVDMSISRGNAAFAWNDNANSMFDAEWSTVGAGVEVNEGLTDLNIYPNPAPDVANVSFTANDAQMLNVSVMDLTGRVFMNTEFRASQGNNLLTLSVKEMDAGNYIVRLNGATISSTLRLVVIK